MSEFENFNDPNIYKSKEDEALTEDIIYANFLKLIDTFHILFKKNIMTKNLRYQDFIYLQGMKCLNHVFILLINYTNNLQFTYYHCEKGIYYFTEFISQIENENSFLKLSSIDAIIFVYKKTIYNINKKMIDNSHRNYIHDVDKVIKFLVNINKPTFYDNIKSYFPNLLAYRSKLNSLEIKMAECTTLKQIEETLKKVL
jgi:hypothetical protein